MINRDYFIIILLYVLFNKAVIEENILVEYLYRLIERWANGIMQSGII